MSWPESSLRRDEGSPPCLQKRAMLYGILLAFNVLVLFLSPIIEAPAPRYHSHLRFACTDNAHTILREAYCLYEMIQLELWLFTMPRTLRSLSHLAEVPYCLASNDLSTFSILVCKVRICKRCHYLYQGVYPLLDCVKLSLCSLAGSDHLLQLGDIYVER